ELKKARSTADENLIYELKHWELKKGDLCEKGSQLRPHIVWFGEAVPNIPRAATIVRQADILIVVGTSLVVYPAAGLVDYAPEDTPVFYVDPNAEQQAYRSNLTTIAEKAGIGLPKLVEQLIRDYA
ncbi:MAG: NAD-dependent deacylase, partial [Bacteroidales bacterium]|nr:NAD-dependent deacylase [Bacteroidales bacterium]